MKKLPTNKIKFKKISFIFVFAILSICYQTQNIARAQEVIRTMTIIPPTIEVKLNPGQTTEGTMKIINESPVPLTFKAETKDFIVVDTKGTPNILPAGMLAGSFSAASWIAMYPNSFTVNPQQKQVINYYIQVPANAKPGGRYAAVVYTPDVTKNSSGVGATVNAQVGTLFYVTVNGPINEKATVTRFFVNPFSEYGPVKILTQIKNLGDLHIRPEGTITVTNLLGWKKTLKLDQHNIFPTTARDFENQYGQTLMFGRYRADLLASYGLNNNLPLMATVYFWVFPWKLAILIILIIIAVVLGMIYLKKKGIKIQIKMGSKKQKEEIENAQ